MKHAFVALALVVSGAVPLAQAGSAKDNVVERPLVAQTLEQFNAESPSR